MATTDADLEVDFEAIDRLKADDKAKTAPPPEITVESVDIAPDKTAPEVLSPDLGIEKLKKQLDDEKQARIDAERRASASAESERQARTENQSTQLDLVTNAIATVTQANDVLESKYADALSAQDFAAAAKINREMTGNAAKLQQLEQGKVNLERAPKPTVRAPADPVESFAARLSPRSGSWVRAHPEFVTNPAKNRQMLAAHEMALAMGETADSEEYFKSIEHTLKIEPARATNGAAHEEDREIDPMAQTAKPVTVRKAAPAAAPPSRSGGGTGSKPNTIRLSSDEVEIAEMMGMSPEEYGRQKMALIKEGKLN